MKGSSAAAKAGPAQLNEIAELVNWIRNWLRGAFLDHPDEIHNLIRSVTHAVDRARNRCSEAYFAGEAGRWLAVYVRDQVNTQIRLLLNFSERGQPAVTLAVLLLKTAPQAPSLSRHWWPPNA